MTIMNHLLNLERMLSYFRLQRYKRNQESSHTTTIPHYGNSDGSARLVKLLIGKRRGSAVSIAPNFCRLCSIFRPAEKSFDSDARKIEKELWIS